MTFFFLRLLGMNETVYSDLHRNIKWIKNQTTNKTSSVPVKNPRANVATKIFILEVWVSLQGGFIFCFLNMKTDITTKRSNKGRSYSIKSHNFQNHLIWI